MRFSYMIALTFLGVVLVLVAAQGFESTTTVSTTKTITRFSTITVAEASQDIFASTILTMQSSPTNGLLSSAGTSSTQAMVTGGPINTKDDEMLAYDPITATVFSIVYVTASATFKGPTGGFVTITSQQTLNFSTSKTQIVSNDNGGGSFTIASVTPYHKMLLNCSDSTASMTATENMTFTVAPAPTSDVTGVQNMTYHPKSEVLISTIPPTSDSTPTASSAGSDPVGLASKGWKSWSLLLILSVVVNMPFD